MVKKIFQAMILILVCISCEEIFYDESVSGTPRNVFNHLWHEVDEKYSFFDLKNVDWDSVYVKYDTLVNNEMSDEELFESLSNMLNELQDAHVSLHAPFNVSKFDDIFLNNPSNFNESLVKKHYLADEYLITGGLQHKTLYRDSSVVGYIYYPSLVETVSENDIDYVVKKYKDADGIILDIRDNTGGNIANVFNISERFADQKRLVYNICLKNGPARDDFTGSEPVYVSPSGDFQFTRETMLLVNRKSYSASNLMAVIMKSFPHCTLIGDTTGGGGGIPTGGELPNGWTYQFSASKTLTPDGFNIEKGIPPDIIQYLNETGAINGIDSIIEKAVDQIMTKK